MFHGYSDTNRVGFIEKIAVMDVYDVYGSIGFIVYVYTFIYLFELVCLFVRSFRIP